MPRSGALLALSLAVLLAGCATREQAGGIPESATVPLLQPHSPYAPERDDPPALRAELIRRERAGMALLRRAAHEPADAAHGCVRASPTVNGPQQPKRWLPEPPKIHARLLGRQVQVDVELQGHPTSLPCRPFVFTIVVSSGRGGTSGFNNIGGVANYMLFAPGYRSVPRRFRVLGAIPYEGSPPYHLSANTESTSGRSTYVELDLPCPPRGCLRRPAAQAHELSIPSPVLPLRGATVSALARSFSAAFAWDPQLLRYEHARCPTTTRCVIDIDSPLRRTRGAATYRVQGEQVNGCWLGTLTGVERTPQEAELTMPATIGGCVGWT